MAQDRVNVCVVCGVTFVSGDATECKVALDVAHVGRIHTTCVRDWEAGVRVRASE